MPCAPVGEMALAGLVVVLAVLVRLETQGGTVSPVVLVAGSFCALLTAPLRTSATATQRALEKATGGVLLRCADPRWRRRHPGTSGLWMLVTDPVLRPAAPAEELPAEAIEAVPVADLPRSGYRKLPGV